ncbi:hypothetical protein BDV27DRAFT_114870 [Aspergillus caelatus]|uniref:Uncharacterized protein n=1 Tax=Aspergillus caelatus TaxID=61420 RepID=A0A5N7A3G6_9EURO|nr:uncharacterized protein BDV27DRAFT_114870 [Aspergillus caelatus]KAE8364411.1 hypothetical protein BDV27DRAFT_114870 [Aspergillus caelatus]
MSDWDVPALDVTSGWQADDAANNTSQTVEIQLPPESDLASSETHLNDTPSNLPDINASQAVNISDDVSTVQSADLDSNEAENVPAQDIPLLQLAPFTEQYEPDDTEFSEFVYERDFVSSNNVLTQLDNLLRLTRLLASRPPNRKTTLRSLLWFSRGIRRLQKTSMARSGKTHSSLCMCLGLNGRPQQNYLPYSWFQKETGVNMRARVCGANLACKIVIELTVDHDSNIVHKAFLKFHARTHVMHYEFVNRTVKEFRSNRRKKQNEHVDDALKQNSYVIIRFVTHGGVGIGLDFDAEFLNKEDRLILWYTKQLATNFNSDPSQKRVIFRLNARYIEYELQNTRTKRKGEEQERFFQQFEHFMEGTRPILAPYRGCARKPYLPMGPIREAEDSCR